MKWLIMIRVFFFFLTVISSFGQVFSNDQLATDLLELRPTKDKLILESNKKALRLRVLCYNIHHAKGVDGKLDIPRIARVILSVKPDLVALQEVDQNTTRSGKVNQGSELSRLTKMQSVFGANIKFQGGHYGNVILSRFPIVQKNNFHLPNFNSGEQRGVLESLIKFPNEQSVYFLATHLDHRRLDKERLDSAKFINQMNSVSNSNNRPAILAGDFNDVPDSPTLKEFGKLWIRTNAEAAPTVPVMKPTRQIDYIMVRPKECWKVIKSRVLDESIASDHRAILAVIELIN